MAVNSLFPYFSRIKYSANGHTHFMTVPLGDELNDFAPGESADQYLFQSNNGLEADFEAAMTAYVDLLKPFFAATASFILAELWGYSSPEADPIFYTAAELGIAGTSGSATAPYSQGVLTMRTALGGIMKVYMMEGVSLPNTVDDYPFAGVPQQNLGAYLIGGTSIILGRDNGKLISPLRFSTKTNDALRKKYLLDG